MTYWIYIMNDKQLILSAKQTFDKIQSKIYGDIQSLLKYAKLNAYEILQAKNPSYSESAAILNRYVNIIRALSDLGIPIPKTALQDLERIVNTFTSLAVAIDESDIDGIGAATAALDCEPYI